MQDAIRVFAGDCTVTFERDRTEPQVQRGAVVVLTKPDNTVLVHDADGYQPAAWLTRADTVRYARDADGMRLVAATGTERLRVESHAEFGRAHFHVSPSGPAVGTCPACESPLVRDGDRVVCIDCLTAHTVPRDATVLDETCGTCGLPTMRVERGAVFEVCVDYGCEPLADAVAARFDGEWPCPDCGDPLSIAQRRGLRAVCDGCGRSHELPVGTVTRACGCGLPRFATPDDERCLDAGCGRDPAAGHDPDDADPTPDGGRFLWQRPHR